MNAADKAQRELEHIEAIYGFWLLDVLFELLLSGKLTTEEGLNLIESL